MPSRDTILKNKSLFVICEIESLRLKGIVRCLYAAAMTSYMEKKEENFASIRSVTHRTRQQGLHSHVSVNLYVFSLKYFTIG